MNEFSYYADWSDEDLDDEIADLNDVIEDISIQLRTYNEFGEADPDWRARAVGALVHRKRQRHAAMKVARQRNRDVGKKSGSAVLENIKADLERAIKKRDAKIQNIHRAQAEKNYEKEAIVAWVRANFPDRLEEVFKVVDAARDEFRRELKREQEAAE